MGDRERLFGYLEGGGKMILAEPQALLTESSNCRAWTGRKMSKSYNNTDRPARRHRSVGDQEDPHHAHRSGAGETQRSGRPGEMPGLAVAPGVFRRSPQDWVQQGCRSAGIGCLDCKQPLIRVGAGRTDADARARPALSG